MLTLLGRSSGLCQSVVHKKDYHMRLQLILAPLLVLTACATPEDRLRTGLYDAGLSKPVSACMASKMVRQLSLTELQRLASLASIRNEHFRDMSVGELYYKVRALRDDHILKVATTAGLSCAIDPSPRAAP